MSDEIKDLIAVNRAVIDQADAWLADLRRAKALNASIRARPLDARFLTRRRRVARFLDRLGWLCFQRPPVDYDSLNVHLDHIAGLDA